MSAAAGPYAGLDRFDARKRVVADLEAQGLLVKVDDHALSVGVCDRCKTVVEPRVSTQWFCKMRPLADAGVGSGGARPDQDCARQPAQDFYRLDGQYSRLVHLAPTLVGTPHSDLALRHCGGMTPARDSRVAIVGGRARARQPARKMREMRRREARARSGRAGHMVQLGALAVFHTGLARRYAGHASVLSDDAADQRLRHSLFLGCTDGHALLASRSWENAGGADSLSHALPALAGSRRAGTKDVQDARERGGPAGMDGKARHRRTALHPGHQSGARNGYRAERRGRRSGPAPLPTRSGTRRDSYS